MILAINTAGPEIGIALHWPQKITIEKLGSRSPFKTRKGKIGIEKIYIGKSEQKSDDLLTKIDKILSQNQVKLDNLKAVIVNQGPGSFTGLRVGISTANALAYALKIPVIGIKNQKNPLKLAKQGYKKFKSIKSKADSKVLPFYGYKI